MNLNPRHLMQLSEIFRAGGFSEAAQLLGTSQPGLSRMVKELEARIGEPVFLRSRKPLQLTPIGKRLVEQGSAISIATKRAAESVDRIRTGDEGELRIGGTPFFLDGFVSSFIAEFQAERPQVTVQLTHGYPGDLVSQLVSDRLDAALCPVELLEPELGLEFTPLFPGHNVVACRVGHPLRSRRKLEHADLLDYPWVAPPPHSPLNADLKQALAHSQTGPLDIIASGGGLGSVINYIAHSDCLTILPHTVLFALRHQGSVSALPVALDHPHRVLGILKPSSGTMAPAVEKLCAYLKTRMDAMLEQIRTHEAAVLGASGTR